jgi:hypothetical protein
MIVKHTSEVSFEIPTEADTHAPERVPAPALRPQRGWSGIYGSQSLTPMFEVPDHGVVPI